MSSPKSEYKMAGSGGREAVGGKRFLPGVRT